MTAHSSLSFAVEVLSEYKPALTRAVTPVIDGTPLTTLVASFEASQQFEPAGGYGGLIPEFFDYGPFDRYWMGSFEPDSYFGKKGSIYVLGCDCGEVGCWPLSCRITVNCDTVVWDGFMQEHRPERDYSKFGPFAFDAMQYSTAVAALQTRLPQSDE